MKKSKKNVLISVVMAALLVFLDQLTKFLAVVNLKNPGKVVEIIPNVFEFRYLENQSAAFGIDLLSIIQRIFKFSYWTNNPEAFLESKNDIFLCNYPHCGCFTVIMVFKNSTKQKVPCTEYITCDIYRRGYRKSY